MTTRVRCSVCSNWSRRRGWCEVGETYIRAPGAWRACPSFQAARPGLPSLADARELLGKLGLAKLVLTLTDTTKGRLLRLAAGATEAERESVYRAVGLRLRPLRHIEMRSGRTATQQPRRGAAGRRAA